MTSHFLIIFFRFEKEYTPRGQRRICDENGQDLVCNDTLKRIQKARAADGSEALKSLARRHLERFQRFEPKTKIRRTGNAANVYQSIEKNDKQRYRRRSLGKLESVVQLPQTTRPQQQVRPPNECDCSVILPLRKRSNFVSEPQLPESNGGGVDNANSSLTYYLQQATDYYEQGFLNIIKYLQNVGERNQVRNKRLQQQLRHSASTLYCTNNNHTTTSSPVSENRLPNASSIRSTEQTPDVVVESEDDCKSSGICNPILKIIAKKRSFRIYNFNQKEREHPGVDRTIHWPIRVQIKPADSVVATVPQGSGTESIKGNCKSSTTSGKLPTLFEKENTNSSAKQDCPYSMNLQLQHLQQGPNINYNNHNHLESVNHHNYPAKELLIETLIDNLQELEIEEYPTNLPRITLSDYTHRYPTDNHASTSLANTSLLRSKNRLNSILLQRQESIDLSSVALDVPIESSDYHSESRPP